MSLAHPSVKDSYPEFEEYVRKNFLHPSIIRPFRRDVYDAPYLLARTLSYMRHVNLSVVDHNKASRRSAMNLAKLRIEGAAWPLLDAYGDHTWLGGWNTQVDKYIAELVRASEGDSDDEQVSAADVILEDDHERRVLAVPAVYEADNLTASDLASLKKGAVSKRAAEPSNGAVFVKKNVHDEAGYLNSLFFAPTMTAATGSRATRSINQNAETCQANALTVSTVSDLASLVMDDESDPDVLSPIKQEDERKQGLVPTVGASTSFTKTDESSPHLVSPIMHQDEPCRANTITVSNSALSTKTAATSSSAACPTKQKDEHEEHRIHDPNDITLAPVPTTSNPGVEQLTPATLEPPSQPSTASNTRVRALISKFEQHPDAPIFPPPAPALIRVRAVPDMAALAKFRKFQPVPRAPFRSRSGVEEAWQLVRLPHRPGGRGCSNINGSAAGEEEAWVHDDVVFHTGAEAEAWVRDDAAFEDDDDDGGEGVRSGTESSASSLEDADDEEEEEESDLELRIDEL